MKDIILANAFSCGMIARGSYGAAYGADIRGITLAKAKELVSKGFQSVVGHSDTAKMLEGILGLPVAFNRVSVQLDEGDVAVIAQYDGPRLAEGTTVLPEGAQFRWFIVEILS